MHFIYFVLSSAKELVVFVYANDSQVTRKLYSPTWARFKK